MAHSKPPRRCEPDQTKRVGIWIRVSTEDQAKGESPDHHERRARCYAEAKGWHVAEVYHLEAISGKTVIDHAETKRMIEHIRCGHITGLVFSKLARLARNTKELLDFADLFREHHADLISLQESIDTTTPAGRLFYTLIAAMAQWEREEIAERVAASVPIRAKLGKPLGGAAPFGYRWENRELIPDPHEAPVRKLLYELFSQHRRKKTVAKMLNEAGHRTRNGSKFSDTTVERLIRDPTAKGVRRANYTRSLGEGKAWVMKPEDQWVLSSVPPIVTEELWVECNGSLDDRKNGRRPAKRVAQLFSGLTYCVCGRKMYVPSNLPKYYCYSCHNKLGKDDLEAVFREQLRDFFLSPDEITAYLGQADQALQGKEELLERLSVERKQVVAQMDKVYQLYMKDGISAEGFGRQYGPLETRLGQLDGELPSLQAEIDFLRVQYLSSDKVVSEAQDLFGRWPELPFEDKRQIVENVVERLEIGQNSVSIRLAYLPTSSEMTAKKQRSDVPALPFCNLLLTAKKPRRAAYPRQIRTIGDRIRERRLDLGLLQVEVAKRLSVNPATITNWETNRRAPLRKHRPAIQMFLGDSPGVMAPGCAVGEQFQLVRDRFGWSRQQLADALGIDESTVASWERKRHQPSRHKRRIVERKLERLLRDVP